MGGEAASNSSGARSYYRHCRTGELGYLVTRGAQQYIRLDRGPREILKPFRDADWIPDAAARNLSKAQLAMITFEAVGAWAFCRGDHAQASKQWESLSDLERQIWIDVGPVSPVYQEMHQAVLQVLERFQGSRE